MERRVQGAFEKIELAAAALTESLADQVAVGGPLSEAREEHEVEMTL
jgi:hypothetical protein